MREIILDIETTGLEFKEGHRIIEIGCIELNKKEVGANYHEYINPSKTLTEDNIKIHGITNEYLTDKPIFEEIADGFLEFKEGHRIIEIGCIELNKKEVGANYHVYINPSKTLTEDNIKIHGITNEYLTDKPIFEEIADSFLEFIQDSYIVAHNASFDIGFLNFELERLSKPTISKERVIDTIKIARQRFPGQQVSLDALIKKLKINTLINRDQHGALKDAKILTDVYLELQGINQIGLELSMAKSEKINLASEPNYSSIVLTKEETEAHKEFIKNKIPNSNWAKMLKNYE